MIMIQVRQASSEASDCSEMKVQGYFRKGEVPLSVPGPLPSAQHTKHQSNAKDCPRLPRLSKGCQDSLKDDVLSQQTGNREMLFCSLLRVRVMGSLTEDLLLFLRLSMLVIPSLPPSSQVAPYSSYEYPCLQLVLSQRFTPIPNSIVLQELIPELSDLCEQCRGEEGTVKINYLRLSIVLFQNVLFGLNQNLLSANQGIFPQSMQSAEHRL